jgi:LacI family transcriptional regulator
MEDANSKNVFVDNQKAMKEAVLYLHEMGHRRIAFLSGPVNSHSSIKRYEGYKEALEILDIPLDPHIVICGDYDFEKASKALDTLLQGQRDFTALICCNDIMAMGAYEVLEKRGMSIPEDLSIIGFDDIFLSRLIKPKLTTIHQPIYEMGVASVNFLIDHIEGNCKCDKIIFETELIRRDSVKKLRD